VSSLTAVIPAQAGNPFLNCEELKMTDVAIVSTARTGLAKSWKGAFNMTYGATLAAHSIEQAVKRAGIDPAEVEDVILGCAQPNGAQGSNVARVAAIRAGLPATTPAELKTRIKKAERTGTTIKEVRIGKKFGLTCEG
jgi:acetyl-CoA acetyltransferase